MKKKIILFSLVLIILILIPTYYSGNLTVSTKNQINKTKATEVQNTFIPILSGYYKKEYNDEALKCIVLILKWNYNINKDKVIEHKISKEKFLKTYSTDDYTRIENAVNETLEINIQLKHQEYIEINYLSNPNNSSKSIKNYPNPWDIIYEDYYLYKDVEGISLNTLNNLCRNGSNYKTALEYFFNKIEITP